ncbi:porin [Kordiimonas sp. SCSIO 12610]|uniref:porin n=1 Tax=Kordiimonas sp. SCSIO 12610 TaxID=2829597 RepID=UPI002109349A|nr:porin [Kordiimonas sp. SCSIO 12610]UTW55449.1 hypothetical protein KFF44_00720 [Kordiimonas sp. SCSIO 12610]
MKRSWKVSIYAFICALSVNSMEIHAFDDDEKRNESEQDQAALKKLDKMIAEIKAAPKPVTASKDPIIDSLELSLRSSEEKKDEGFLYLQDKSSISTINSQSASHRPGFSSLLAPSNAIRGNASTIFDGSSRIGLSFGSNEEEGERGLEVAIESAYTLSGTNPQLNGNNYDLSDPFADRSYNVGLSVGYSGFNLNASVIREESLWNGGTEGFGVGFSYTGSRWTAKLSLSEYKEGTDLQGINNEVRNFVSVELGASFELSRRFGLLGGIRYYDQRNSYLSQSDFGSAQTFFLGGRLKF